MLLSIFFHLLFAGLVAFAGATAGRALAAPSWFGAALGLLIYGLGAAGAWLSDRPVAGPAKQEPWAERGGRFRGGKEKEAPGEAA